MVPGFRSDGFDMGDAAALRAPSIRRQPSGFNNSYIPTAESGRH